MHGTYTGTIICKWLLKYLSNNRAIGYNKSLEDEAFHAEEAFFLQQTHHHYQVGGAGNHIERALCFFPGKVPVKLFCDAAIMVKQELQVVGIPLKSGSSPLFWAAK
jgi:hypothetical protein